MGAWPYRLTKRQSAVVVVSGRELLTMRLARRSKTSRVSWAPASAWLMNTQPLARKLSAAGAGRSRRWLSTLPVARSLTTATARLPQRGIVVRMVQVVPPCPCPLIAAAVPRAQGAAGNRAGRVAAVARLAVAVGRAGARCLEAGVLQRVAGHRVAAGQVPAAWGEVLNPAVHGAGLGAAARRHGRQGKKSGRATSQGQTGSSGPHGHTVPPRRLPCSQKAK